MDDKTRGVNRDDEFSGRGSESTRGYAAEPDRSAPPVPPGSPGAADQVAGRARDAEGLDPAADRRTRELQGDIAHTRAELSETIDALQEKLSPANIASEARNRVKTATTDKVRDMADTASERAQDFVESARQNPIPALMIGAGVAWMLIDRTRDSGRTPSSRRGRGWASQSRYGAYDERDEYGSESVQGRAEGALAGARQNVQAASSWARESTDEARHTARRAQNGFQRMLRENPLLVGAAAMLAGAAVGASLPETERENELMGETRDTLVDRAQEAAENAVTATKEAANDVVGDTVSKVAERVTSPRQS